MRHQTRYCIMEDLTTATTSGRRTPSLSQVSQRCTFVVLDLPPPLDIDRFVGPADHVSRIIRCSIRLTNAALAGFRSAQVRPLWCVLRQNIIRAGWQLIHRDVAVWPGTERYLATGQQVYQTLLYSNSIERYRGLWTAD